MVKKILLLLVLELVKIRNFKVFTKIQRKRVGLFFLSNNLPTTSSYYHSIYYALLLLLIVLNRINSNNNYQRITYYLIRPLTARSYIAPSTMIVYM